MHPLISILVPIYNADKYLKQCLDSIVGQTYKDIQIVLIDDGSTDNSFEVMQQFATTDARIEVCHQTNCGVAETRNHLLRKAKGDFVLFVDSDDWIEPTMVDLLLKEQTLRDYDIVVCENAYDCTWNREEAIIAFLRHVDFNGALWNKLIRRSLFDDLQFIPEISYGEDALMIWQVLQRVNQICITSLKLYHHQMNDESISHQRFGPKKMSGHKVWETIVFQTKQWWPQYIDIARARFAAEDMWQLYFASKSGYPQDNYIKMLQRHVREEYPLLKQSGLINTKKLIFAWLISHCYLFGKLLRV